LLLKAQQKEQPNLQGLDTLKASFFNAFLQEQKRAQEYSVRYNVPIRSMGADGSVIQLVDVNEFGEPVYRSTFNNGLAVSTNVVKLRSGGGLGLDLKGTGMEVGVWDSGPVFEHDEFLSRILTREGGTTSSHGSHVAGTILAGGLNQSAMGMAPEAKLHSYDWNNDRSEMASMARSDQSGLLFSNHSYGLVQGWNCQNGSCTWTGSPGISDKEDWRFGFYTTLARDLDQIAFNAPYYSIFWAAGNDRDDRQTIGAPSYPADGNQGSGYDCISQEGTAKNIFTIGAIRKVPDYAGPASVEMSGFSGWGPTDDGRIKPDLVAPGVDIFSTFSDNAYATQSGTSMATPGALGSVTLLQELQKNLNGGKFMRSSTLKALTIHTAKEAGLTPGPDYSFGWGLLDVEAAAKVLLTRDNQNVFVEELNLISGEAFELTLNPQANTKITATISWTDPAGTPVGSQLDPTNLMLVNDLDMRIVDEANNQQFPWALNPELSALAEAAFKADNFRDNVEKIEFNNPEPRTYKLRVNHKGSLAGGNQNFSLILTYTSINEPQTAYYWVGGGGDWNDPAHWALSSGGVSAGVVPNENNRVVVDENSFSINEEIISISENVVIGSITWLNKSHNGIHLNGNTITVRGNFIFGSEKAFISSTGKIILDGSLQNENKVLTTGNDFSTIDLEVNTNSKISMNGSLIIQSLNLVTGNLNLSSSTIKVTSLQANGSSPKTLNLAGSSISGFAELKLNTNTLEWTSDGALLTPANNSIMDLGNRTFNGKIRIVNQNISLLGNNTLKELEVSGKVQLKGNNTISSLTLNSNSSFMMDAGTIQTLTQTTQIASSAGGRVVIDATSGKSSVKFDGRYKLCFDYLDINNVDVTGDAIINAGISSTLTNSSNWAKDKCDDILFPDFDIVSNCANGIIQLVDKSGGLISNWLWTTSNPSATLIKETNKLGSVIFPQAGEFEISLRISNSNDSRIYKKTISVVANDLPVNEIILNGLNLFSTQSADTYEWYKNFEIIPNASGRSYPFNGEPGSYFILTKSNSCNRISNTVLITAANEPSMPIANSMNIFPNPAEKSITITGLDHQVTMRIMNVTGQVVYESKISPDEVIPVENWPRGMYIVTIMNNLSVVTKKIILR
jgi:hypothetical protein